MKKPLILEVFADNGLHSHWALVDTQKGEKLWSEDPTECEAMGYPVNPTQKELELTTQLAKANSDKERLGELLKEIYNKTKETKNPPPPAAMVRIRLTLQDCGISL